jgi:hypothetical protein
LAAAIEASTGARRDGADNQEWLRRQFPNSEAGLRTAVVIPCCGQPAMTADCVRDCLREDVDVLVVDSAGDYRAVDREHVVRPRENLGWAGACALGLDLAWKLPFRLFVLLNNDTRLSKGFFAGLVRAAEAVPDAGIISASYDDHQRQMRPETGCPPAGEYQPVDRHINVGAADGTCLAVTRRLIELVGLLDVGRFGAYGWGAAADLCIRAKVAGLAVVVTRAAYCNHLGQRTARRTVGNDYPQRAAAEARQGMLAKWGPDHPRMAATVSLPRPEITIRHLIYHICPLTANDVWRKNLAQLRRRWHLFNGRRILSIAAGPGCRPPHDVLAELSGLDFDAFTVRNSVELRETPGFIRLLWAIETTAPNEAAFYAHTKGVTRPAGHRGVRYWRNLMYHALLDDLEAVTVALRNFPIVGTHRQLHEQPLVLFPGRTVGAKWHFAGTFFWFRCRDVFMNPKWADYIQQTGWASEAWPGWMFPYDRSFCMAVDNPRNPYAPCAHPIRIEDD